MSRITVPTLVFACAALIGTTSCSPTTSQQSADTGTASASASVTPTHFQRLGYSLAVPQGWHSQEGSLDWAGIGGPPRVGVPTFDDILSPSEDPRILVGEQPVGDSAPLEQWIAYMRSVGAITYPSGCNPAEDQSSTTLGGEPAQLLAFHCPSDGPNAVIAQVLARHADTGWVVSCFSTDGVAGGLSGWEQQCEGWMTSFRFEP
jgi:hypothetical protein